MQATAEGEFYPEKNLDKNYKIPKKEAGDMSIASAVNTQQPPPTANLNKVNPTQTPVATPYYNYAYDPRTAAAYYQNAQYGQYATPTQAPPPQKANFNFIMPPPPPPPSDGVEPIKRDIFNTLNAIKEKPKQYTKNISNENKGGNDNQGYVNQANGQGYGNQGYNTYGSNNQGYRANQSYNKQGHQANASYNKQGYGANQNYNKQGYEANASYNKQGYGANQNYNKQGYAANQGYNNQGYGAKQNYTNQGYAANQNYNSQGSGAKQNYNNQGYGAANQSYNKQGYGANQNYNKQGYNKRFNQQHGSDGNEQYNKQNFQNPQPNRTGFKRNNENVSGNRAGFDQGYNNTQRYQQNYNEGNFNQNFNNQRFNRQPFNKQERSKPVEKPPVQRPVEQYVPDLLDQSLPKDLKLLFQPLYCKLCSAQLSSNQTAKAHYQSKNHEKKIRKWLTEWAEKTGEPLPERALATGTKKAEAASDKNPTWFHCDVCDLELTGKLHAESHYMGRNHQKALLGHKAPAGQGFYKDGKWVRVKGQKPKSYDFEKGEDNFGGDFKQNKVEADAKTVSEGEPPAKKKKEAAPPDQFHCDVCEINTTCQEQLDNHFRGHKHLKKLKQLGLENNAEARKLSESSASAAVPLPANTTPSITEPPIDPDLNLSVFRTPSGDYYCPICNLTTNSEPQFIQHMRSKGHAKKAAQKKTKGGN